MSEPVAPLRIMLLGATGTIGRATAQALVASGHEVVCFVRPDPTQPRRGLPDPAILRFGNVADPAELEQIGFAGERFDALLSCLASRTGQPTEAWAIDYQAHVDALCIAQAAGISQMILLSAICVQRPLLAFQHAKLAFEQKLQNSGVAYSIVRPTAFFKSLSGQVERVRQGKAFLLFGDGRLTSCKPISDADLAAYLAGCLGNSSRRNRILPIGGPGPAITPRQQGEYLFRVLGRPPKFRSIPISVMDAIVTGLRLLSPLSPRFREKAELAKIGRFYATESMLVLDPRTGQYNEDLTPSTGAETLFDFYDALLSRKASVDLGAHSVFKRRAA